ncbi:hypothetical protein GXW71_28350 [Roseomonas hellenica]|uniref:Uncharacterized protein n=1 Tax=Plastoroseomonas hellenica TaxID=2687306 RepID=A0ABS5F6W6_9PROT|nr:hypothetical protein [Plastoroseomonas hellenica]MBR0668297.1 hypothetical protein [Plastoroseomonas hellenica]
MTNSALLRRRLLLCVPALLLSAAPHAEEVEPQPVALSPETEAEAEEEAERRAPAAIATPCPVRLTPNAEPVTLSTRIDGASFVIAFDGEGAPAERITLPSRYGHARIIGLLPVRGRELVLAAFEANTGSGEYQEMAAVIGREDSGLLRIIGLETIRYRRTGACDAMNLLTGRFTAQPDGTGLRYDVFARGLGSSCPSQRGASPSWREEFGTTLRWTGTGVLTLPVRRSTAGRTRIRVEAARARAITWLRAGARRTVTLGDVRLLGLMDTLADA